MLLLSIIALLAGPLAYHWLHRGGRIVRAVEHVLVAALVVIVAFLLVPETLEALGTPAIVLIAAGYLVPGALELAIRQVAHTLHALALAVALAGMAVHAGLDGAGLAASEQQASAGLAFAIILHRFSVGLVLWLMVQPVFGRKIAGGSLALIAIMTVVGFVLSEQFSVLESVYSVQVVQALIIGTIVHGLVHRGHGRGD